MGCYCLGIAMTNKNYTFQEVFNASLEYFKGDELAANVFASKYALFNPKTSLYDELTPTDLHRRLARGFARIESKYSDGLSEEEIYNYLSDWTIVPQGSPMAGIGNPYQLMSISNCFVVDSPSDSIGSIHKTDEEEAQIMKRRGGVGFDISKLRPRGDITANAAKTTDGIGEFMEQFSNTCRRIAQGGRRGALMLTISVHHPEIRTFIKIKRDLKKVTGANISIRVSDEFMKAVENDREVELRFPVEKGGKVYEKVSAKEIWDEIIGSAHSVAEPGVLFWDNVKQNTPSDVYAEQGFSSNSTNPCQPGWATILTPKGIRTFDDIEVGSIVWSGKRWTRVIRKIATGTKPIYAFHTRAGTFNGTENHRVMSDGEKIEVSDAETIDVATGAIMDEDGTTFDNQVIMDGIVLGDGSAHKASNDLVHLYIGMNDQDYHQSEIAPLILKHRPGIKETAWEIKTTITAAELPLTYNRQVPSRFRFGNRQIIRSFLRGLYTANGSVVRDRITLKAASIDIITAVQEMLSSLGIASYYTTNKSQVVIFSNGAYECRQSYDLNITCGRMLFRQLIGFIQVDKTAKLNAICDKERSKYAGKRAKTSFEIVSKTLLGEEPVFDITVDDEEHTYWTGGLLVSNCGEIILAGDSKTGADACRLLLVNALKFVSNPFTNKASFDFERFNKVCRVAQRLMDDIVDLELECVDKIIEKIESDPEDDFTKAIELNLWKGIKNKGIIGRRTGTGLTGVGDTLAALGISYSEKAAPKTIGLIYKALALACYEETIELAEQRGAFPIFNYKQEKEHPFIKKIIEELPAKSQAKYKKYGRRNIALTTTAPAGSVSLLTQTTSGIEPAYMLKYDRWKKINPNEPSVKVDRVDALGDSWQKFVVYHHGFKQWMEVSGKTEVEDSPYYKATANEIDWLNRVKCQAAAQEWICHSISSTVNVPADISVEAVKQIYMEGWKSGCKGITVYRDGSRDGVLTSETSSNQKESFSPRNAIKRPDVLPCEVYRVKIKDEDWTLFLGILNGNTYEIIGGLSKFVALPKKLKEGRIVKTKKGQASFYNFEAGTDEDLIEVKDLVNVFENPTYGSFTRTLSLALRHGASVQHVVEQLQKGDKESDMFTFSKAISRVLKTKIKDGTKVNAVCKECSSTALEYREGCITCMSCGHSKCG